VEASPNALESFLATGLILLELLKILIEILSAQTSLAPADDLSASATNRWQRALQSKKKLGTQLFMS